MNHVLINSLIHMNYEPDLLITEPNIVDWNEYISFFSQKILQ